MFLQDPNGGTIFSTNCVFQYNSLQTGGPADKKTGEFPDGPFNSPFRSECIQLGREKVFDHCTFVDLAGIDGNPNTSILKLDNFCQTVEFRNCIVDAPALELGVLVNLDDPGLPPAFGKKLFVADGFLVNAAVPRSSRPEEVLTADDIAVEDDPLLAADNIHLESGSPAINAADNVGVLDDFDGDDRPQGGGFDIGADERTDIPDFETSCTNEIDDDQDGDTDCEDSDCDLDLACVDETLFVRGDADSSGNINLTDGVFLLNFLFLGAKAPTCRHSADANDSGDLNLTDAIVLFNWLFLGGERPPEPSPSGGNYPRTDCGTDPTPDELECQETSQTCQ